MDHKTNPLVSTVPRVLILALVVALAIVASAQNPSPQAGPSGYHLLKTIPVGGTEGWDYVTMDSDARRLYIGRDDQGRMIGALVFVGDATIHGSVRVATAFGPDGKVRGAGRVTPPNKPLKRRRRWSSPRRTC